MRAEKTNAKQIMHLQDDHLRMQNDRFSLARDLLDQIKQKNELSQMSKANKIAMEQQEIEHD